MSRVIRFARPGEGALIERLVRSLAVYEKLEHAMQSSAEDFERLLFGDHPCAEVLLAEAGGEVVGFALFFPTLSSFAGRPKVHLEDLFVVPEARGAGHGKALLAALAQLAVERGACQLTWVVLDWNAPAIAFYESLGARLDRSWIPTALEGEALRTLGETAEPLA